MCYFLFSLSWFVIFVLVVVLFGFWKDQGDVGPKGPHINLTPPYHSLFLFWVLFFVLGFVFFCLFDGFLFWVLLKQTHQTNKHEETYKTLFSRFWGHFWRGLVKEEPPKNKRIVSFSNNPS